jgi:hypothetical protein
VTGTLGCLGLLQMNPSPPPPVGWVGSPKRSGGKGGEKGGEMGREKSRDLLIMARR